jgi:hypothetical protein
MAEFIFGAIDPHLIWPAALENFWSTSRRGKYLDGGLESSPSSFKDIYGIRRKTAFHCFILQIWVKNPITYQPQALQLPPLPHIMLFLLNLLKELLPLDISYHLTTSKLHSLVLTCDMLRCTIQW